MGEENSSMSDVINLLKELRKRLGEHQDKFEELNDIRKAQWINELVRDILGALNKINTNKEKINEFINLSDQFREAPTELLYILSIPDLPYTISSGKRIAETIAGYRGLGIETIDHKIDEIKYEDIDIPIEESPLSEVSITSFIYRVSPFELTRPVFEHELDKQLTDILGARFVWLVKPRGVTFDSWRGIESKTTFGKKKDIILASYETQVDMLVPNEIQLIDLSKRSLFIEIKGNPPFFIKFGSSIIERDTSNSRTKSKLVEHLKEKQSQFIEKTGNVLASWGIRLDYPYFCYKGLGLTTDPYDTLCPFVKSCPLGKPNNGPCDGSLYWSGNYKRRKFYPKVYPLKRLRVRTDGFKTAQYELLPNTVRYEAFDKRQIEARWYGIDIATWFINARPTIRILFDSEIGYSIPTSLICINIDDNWLKQFVTNVLAKDSKIRRYIALKFILNKALGRRLNYNTLTKVMMEILEGNTATAQMYKDYISGRIDDEFIRFIKATLLHSLEHMLTQYILDKIAGVDISFVLTKYEHKYSNRIIVAENAKGGKIGIVDTLTRFIDEKGFPSFILEFSDWISNYLAIHGRDFERHSNDRKIRSETMLRQVIKRLEYGNAAEKAKAKTINEVITKVSHFKNKLNNAQVDIDITLARIILLAGARPYIRQEDIEQAGDFFDDILEKFGFLLCLDGCNACVRLERYCTEGTSQILTTSRLLLQAFAEMIKDIISRGITIRSNKMINEVGRLLFNPRKSLNVISPYISPRYAQRLIELAQSGIIVKIITWMPRTDEEKREHGYQVESLRILKDKIDNDKLFVKVFDKPDVKLPHDKTYIIDHAVITGSFNLTEAGLHGNFERAKIDIHPLTVDEEKNQFERLWNEGTDLQNYDLDDF